MEDSNCLLSELLSINFKMKQPSSPPSLLSLPPNLPIFFPPSLSPSFSPSLPPFLLPSLLSFLPLSIFLPLFLSPFLYSQRAVYQNLDDLYQDNSESATTSEPDSFGYGDEKIYESICYYQSPVSELGLQ